MRSHSRVAPGPTLAARQEPWGYAGTNPTCTLRIEVLGQESNARASPRTSRRLKRSGAKHFLPLLTTFLRLQAQGRSRPRQQALDAYGLAGFLAVAIFTGIDALQ